MASPYRKKVDVVLAVVDPFTACSSPIFSAVGQVNAIGSFPIDSVGGYSILTPRASEFEKSRICVSEAKIGGINTLTIDRENPLSYAAFLLSGNSPILDLQPENVSIKVAARTGVNQWSIKPSTLEASWAKWRATLTHVGQLNPSNQTYGWLQLDPALVGSSAASVKAVHAGFTRNPSATSGPFDYQTIWCSEAQFLRERPDIALKIQGMVDRMDLSERFETDAQLHSAIATDDARTSVYWYEGTLVPVGNQTDTVTLDICLPATTSSWAAATDVHIITPETTAEADRRSLEALKSFEVEWLNRLNSITLGSSRTETTLAPFMVMPANALHPAMSDTQYDFVMSWWAKWQDIFTQVLGIPAAGPEEEQRKEQLWQDFLKKNPGTNVTRAQFLANPASFLPSQAYPGENGTSSWWDTIMKGLDWAGDGLTSLLSNDTVMGAAIGAGGVALLDDDLKPWLIGGAVVAVVLLLR